MMLIIYFGLFGFIAFLNFIFWRKVEKKRDKQAKQRLEYKKKQLYGDTKKELEKLKKDL